MKCIPKKTKRGHPFKTPSFVFDLNLAYSGFAITLVSIPIFRVM